MIKKSLLVVFCLLSIAICSFVFAADSEVTLDTSDADSGFTVKDSVGAPVMSARGDGNVGIGTTSPGAKLHVGGNPGTDGIMFPDGTLQTTAAITAPGGTGEWMPIETQILSSASGSMVFSSIPANYALLKLVISAHATGTGGRQLRLTFNNDANNNYKSYLKSMWSTLNHGVDNTSWVYLAHMDGGVEGWCLGESLITNFTDQYKRVSTNWTDMGATYSHLGMGSAVWKNTLSKITSIKIEASDGTNPSSFDVGSRITLMGMN